MMDTFVELKAGVVFLFMVCERASWIMTSVVDLSTVEPGLAVTYGSQP